MDELLLLTLVNLADLQNEWQNELDLKRKTKRALEIVRMVFNFSELIQLKDEFMKEFGNFIQSEYPSLPATQVMMSIKNFIYVVSAKKAGNITVSFSLPEDHNKKFDIEDSNLFKLLRECERILLDLMKAHNEPKGKESGGHVKITLKVVESFKELMGDGDSTSAHYEEKVEPFNDGASPSLCGSNGRDLSYGPSTSNNDKPKGEHNESTGHTEEIVGTKAEQPSSLKGSTQNRIKVPVEVDSEQPTFHKGSTQKSNSIPDEHVDESSALEKNSSQFERNDSSDIVSDTSSVKSEPETTEQALMSVKSLDSMVTDDEKSQRREKVKFTRISATNDDESISAIPTKETKKLKEPETGLLSPAETTDTEDEESEGEDIDDTEKLRRKYNDENCKRYKKHKKHVLSIKAEDSNESSANIDLSDPLCVLTYDDTGSNEIKHCSFKDKQEALQWAHENVYRRDKKNVFVKVWNLQEENSSSLKTNDLMVHKIQLRHPLEPTIVETMESMFDTGAEFASVSFDPAIAQNFLNSATEINGELRHTFYGKLTIDGTELNKIYEIDFDSDDNWCAFGLPQMADLDERKAEETLVRIGEIIHEKKKN